MTPLVRHALRGLCVLALAGAGLAALTRPTEADAPGEPPARRARTEAPAADATGARERARGGASEGSAGRGRARVASPLEGFDPRQHRAEDGVLVSDLPGHRTAVLSLDAGLQAHMTSIFDRYDVPHAGLVAMDPSTGRVLAYVSHAEDGTPGDVARDASAPAASVFKIVTGAALLEAGLSADERVCFHGGASSIGLEHLTFDASRDRTCATLGEAMGRSLNPVFARLADAHLDAATLGRFASAFGFGEALPFDAPTNASGFDVPTERVERARMAAGFWHSHLSPLHGALLAATVANHGRMPRANMVERVLDDAGHTVFEAHPETFRSVIGRRTAERLSEMMQRTVREGTSRRAFRDDAGHEFIPGVAIAGKTGTLSEERPYRGYTWWVGFAPADHPTIALGVLVVNTPEWRIKASHAARFALQYWLVDRPGARR